MKLQKNKSDSTLLLIIIANSHDTFSHLEHRRVRMHKYGDEPNNE